MKFIGLREAQAGLSGLVTLSQREKVILTRHGQPIALITGLKGQDLEDVLLSQDPAFRRLIKKRRDYKGPLVSHESMVASTRAELRRGSGRAEGRQHRRRKAVPRSRA